MDTNTTSLDAAKKYLRNQGYPSSSFRLKQCEFWSFEPPLKITGRTGVLLLDLQHIVTFTLVDCSSLSHDQKNEWLTPYKKAADLLHRGVLKSGMRAMTLKYMNTGYTSQKRF